MGEPSSEKGHSDFTNNKLNDSKNQLGSEAQAHNAPSIIPALWEAETTGGSLEVRGSRLAC